MKRINMIGSRFERWQVLNAPPKGRHWYCKCDCGTEKFVDGRLLRTGKSSSCGCRKREVLSEIHRTHGKSGNRARVYWIWLGMRQRCSNPKNPNFKDYGDRGITVCERWNRFENFVEDMGEPPLKYTLERKNNSLGYFPENCEWETRKIQGRNKRNNRLLTFNGETLPLPEWAERTGLDGHTISHRIHRGKWSIERALTTPKRKAGVVI